MYSVLLLTSIQSNTVHFECCVIVHEYFCRELMFSDLTLIIKYFRNTIELSNSLTLRSRRNVGLDLGSNILYR